MSESQRVSDIAERPGLKELVEFVELTIIVGLGDPIPHKNTCLGSEVYNRVRVSSPKHSETFKKAISFLDTHPSYNYYYNGHELVHMRQTHTRRGMRHHLCLSLTPPKELYCSHSCRISALVSSLASVSSEFVPYLPRRANRQHRPATTKANTKSTLAVEIVNMSGVGYHRVDINLWKYIFSCLWFSIYSHKTTGHVVAKRECRYKRNSRCKGTGRMQVRL